MIIDNSGDISIAGSVQIAGSSTLAIVDINGGTIGSVTIGQLTGALDANSQIITNINIDSGSITGLTELIVDNVTKSLLNRLSHRPSGTHRT